MVYNLFNNFKIKKISLCKMFMKDDAYLNLNKKIPYCSDFRLY